MTTPHEGVIEPLLNDVSEIVRRSAPHLEWLFNVFAEEARVGRQWLDSHLQKLDPAADILEVGAGLMLLSCQLVKEGFTVTALEPIGEGFSSFGELQEIVLAYAASMGITPHILPLPVEALEQNSVFDFAFSMNVMEHVSDVPLALKTITCSLRPGAKYCFTCANYSFPYEPHFNIPTLFSKSLTEKVFRKQIFSNVRVGDPAGVWKSLNWITVSQVTRVIRGTPGFTVSFDRLMLRKVLLRVITDPEFSNRRSPLIRKIVRFWITSGLVRFTEWLPASLQPAMGCTITRHDSRAT